MTRGEANDALPLAAVNPNVKHPVHLIKVSQDEASQLELLECSRGGRGGLAAT